MCEQKTSVEISRVTRGSFVGVSGYDVADRFTPVAKESKLRKSFAISSATSNPNSATQKLL